MTKAPGSKEPGVILGDAIANTLIPIRRFVRTARSRDAWLRDSNRIIARLRANGNRYLILLEYSQWSATFRFDKKEGPEKACESPGCEIDCGGGVKAPLGLTSINAYRYVDRGSSSTSNEWDAKTNGFAKFAEQLRRRGLNG